MTQDFKKSHLSKVKVGQMFRFSGRGTKYIVKSISSSKCKYFRVKDKTTVYEIDLNRAIEINFPV